MSKISLTPEELSDLIGLVYDSAFEEQQWRSLLHRISNMFPGVVGLAYGYDGDTMLPEYISTKPGGIVTESVELTFKSVTNMTAAEALQRTPNGFVMRTNVFIDTDEWKNSEIYQNILRPEGILHTLQMKIDHNGDRGALLTFGIPEDTVLEKKLHDPLFEVLKLLAPHAVRAAQLARALSMAKKATEIFSGFLDGIILPMLVTDVSGRFLFGNAAGRRVLERGHPFSQTAHGRLELPESYETESLYHKLKKTDRDLAQSGMRIETSDTPLMLAITPFRPSMRDASAIDRHLMDEERLFAVFVGQSASDAVNTQLLEDVFDLTLREAEVCKQLLLGHGVTEIADMADRSPKTVRNQIQVIYEKIGVSSNTALMDALSVFRTVGTMFDDAAGAIALTKAK